ncbi:MAG: hypothetical protein FVQ80_12750 [Planctomycetes bacterium]|nr:hypothetical protein [Planctomycetota bacterium]
MSSIIDKNVSPTDIYKEYDKSIFIWLDILGFSIALDDESRYEDLSNHLESYQSLFNESSDYETNIISDGIILRITNPQYFGYERFKRILENIGEKQYQFICETKEFIRGGIAVGSKLENNPGRSNQYVSNGLARAVKIESSHVNWPIIGTNEKNISEIRELFNIDDKEENFCFFRGFNKNGEDIYFIDFIKENGICDLIISKINENEGNPGIRNKYIWLFRYYLHKYGDRGKVIIPLSLLEVVL